MKKVIFWDSDGTLLYGNESFKTSLMRAFDEFGYSINEDTARDFMRGVCTWYVPEKDHSDKNGEEWWEELLENIRVFCKGAGVAEADIAPICTSFRERVVKFEYVAYSDAKQVLHSFKERGYDNYIISNNFPELDEVFKKLGLGDDIAGYFLSASIGYEKPRREIFEHAIFAAGYPEIKYMVGDNPIADYQGGLDAGMMPVLVHNKKDGLKCCNELMELLEIIP